MNQTWLLGTVVERFPEQTLLCIVSSETTILEGGSNFKNSFSPEFCSTSSFSEGHWLTASPGPQGEGVEDLHGYVLRRDRCHIMQRKGEKRYKSTANCHRRERPYPILTMVVSPTQWWQQK